MKKKSETELLELWFYTNGLGDSTQEIYTRIMKQYAEFLDKNIEEIYENALQEEKENIFFHERQYRTDMIRYNNYLEKEGRSVNTRKTHMAAIKSFFEAHGIREPKVKFKRGNTGKKENWGHLLSKDEINTLIEVCNTRDKAIIRTMALTGMSQQEARELKIKDLLTSVSNELKERIRNVEELFKVEKELENKVLTLNMRREKVSYDYITFLPPEAIKAIIIYLKERQFGRNKKIRIKNTKSPIFVLRDGKNMGINSVSAVFKAAGKRSGLDIDHEVGVYRSWRSHGMRRYFISTIMNELHMHDEADFMAGHQISEQNATYWRSDPKKLKKVYLKALPYLSLENVEVYHIESEEFKDITTKLNDKDEEIVDLKKRMASMEKLLVNEEYMRDKLEERS